jgi:hypothetical protein
LKPAVKTKPNPRGGQAWPKQPINKTIGINKLGTLLSSQTTDTPGTTTTNKQPWIAPEQLFKLTCYLHSSQIGDPEPLCRRHLAHLHRLTPGSSAEINSTTTLPG